MITIKADFTVDEVVEMISVLAIIEVHAPDKAVRARTKLKQVLSDAITEHEFHEFEKSVDKFLKQFEK